MHIPGFHPVVCVVVAGAEDGGVEVGGEEDLLDLDQRGRVECIAQVMGRREQ